jgi:hypothetical protein
MQKVPRLPADAQNRIHLDLTDELFTYQATPSFQ